ncbi:TonB family protein [bacterium]|nr:TonB family protein [bacterium]
MAKTEHRTHRYYCLPSVEWAASTLFISTLSLSISTMPVNAAPAAKPPAKKAVAKPAAKPAVSEDQFMQSLQEKISSTPNKIPVDKDTKVVVMINISGTGALESVTVKESSGIAALDAEAVARVKSAAPFGAMPPGFKTGLNLTYTFQFKAAIRAGAPQEKVDTEPYMQELARKVSDVWSPPDVPKSCTVSLNFVLDKEGKVKSVEITRPSGFEVVDEKARQAVMRAAPYGNLPEGLNILPVRYMFAAGPSEGGAEKYQWNGKPLEKANWQVSRSGSTLKPLDVSKKVENQVNDRKWKIQDEIESLKSRLEKADAQNKKAEILADIGRNYRKINDFENATRSFEQAAAILKSENTADEAILKAELAEAYFTKGDSDRALGLFEEAASRLRTDKTENVAELKKVLQEYARALYKVKRTEEADKLYAEIRSLK